MAGKDRRAYSYDAPNEAELENFDGETRCIRRKERIVFTGLLNYHDYRELWYESALLFYNKMLS